METPKVHLFKVGDIVALRSHPYTNFQHKVLISGEPQLISPLMVIVESIGDLQDVHDEFTGINLQKKGETSNCKCVWYSSKSAQFEEAWLSSKLLKLIQEKVETVSEEIVIGTIVTLSTAQLELSKVKSSLNIEDEKVRTNLNPLLSFVSPLMQVIGVPKNDKKEALYDVKTGNKKREISKQLIKCKWFNPSSDKMSEALIPIEALSIIPAIEEEKLNKYATYVKNKQHILIRIEGSQTILLPQKIKYLHGIYSIVGYDYIENKTHAFEILKLTNPDELPNPFINYAPNFDNEEIRVLSIRDQIRQLINYGSEESKYLRIRYKDINNNLTIRTIKQYSIESININDTPIEYLAGFCKLRKDERHFQLDRIQSVEILNISYPTPDNNQNEQF
ncbi:WYL domain-containing protein [Flectobacillus roseus]|uniref:WYL domain-containing protein n=1 Tax=Flectobacillus roseus TaxID=502259 RepID=UPI0024B8480D|nr:WYL domain-containing protein [Flectobacillus roseus]MDI9868584.1 WYL domain-containing protein [Flectobacillus roseus]